MSMSKIFFLLANASLIVGYFLSWISGASFSGFDTTVLYFKTGEFQTIILGVLLGLITLFAILGFFVVLFSSPAKLKKCGSGFVIAITTIIYFVLTWIFSGTLELFPTGAALGYYLFLVGIIGSFFGTIMVRAAK